jgi:anti-sigma B factor antagonist
VAQTFAFQIASGADVVVRLSGELDLATVGPVRDYLLGLDDSIVTLDFCGVTFIDSTGVKLLVQLQEGLRERGGKLVLYGIQPEQRRVLDAVGVVDFFDCMIPD